MTTYKICELDEQINGQELVPVPTALKRVETFIVTSIDPTFPVDAFRAWYNSPTEKPFRWNRKRYCW